MSTSPYSLIFWCAGADDVPPEMPDPRKREEHENPGLDLATYVVAINCRGNVLFGAFHAILKHFWDFSQACLQLSVGHWSS